MKTSHFKPLALLAAILLPLAGFAQVNSGSNGSDGAFNPTQNVTINMADHPTGIYQYTSVNIPQGVTVSFTPNANNTPVVWLVQGDCTIGGLVDVSGQLPSYRSPAGAIGGPGGYRGGDHSVPGAGPGGGPVGANYGGGGSYGTLGVTTFGPAGVTYGNAFILPLLGGSGGGGSNSEGAGGGGGAILIAATG